MKKSEAWDIPYALEDRALHAYRKATGESEFLDVIHREIDGREFCIVLKHGAAAAVYLIGKDRELRRLRRVTQHPDSIW